ncbi:unnamed protein product [Nippostrongylus brasiliensis]|uniref:RxLR effector candidate protein n=1 Tax=Nippostrongylus brasiliensis TaxID=27835 RepID=A0A0N4YJJ8_NIPBR|nr:unnamed protein product [Nippostrongylus brasiliensis]
MKTVLVILALGSSAVAFVEQIRAMFFRWHIEDVRNFQIMDNPQTVLVEKTEYKDQVAKDLLVDSAKETDRKDRRMEEAAMEDPTAPRASTGPNVLHQGEATEAVPTSLKVETVYKDPAVMDPAMGTDHKDRLTKEAATEDLIALRVGSGLNVLHLGGAMEVLLTALGVETVHKDRTVMDPVM